MTAPLPFVWTGQAFEPRPNFARRARETYGAGEVVMLAPVDERSMISHAHEFAWLKDAWSNLPEHLTDQFPSPESLRKKALIATGWYNETITDVGSKAGAIRTAAMVSALLAEEFAHVVARGPLVVTRRAKSQSREKMKRADFQESKTAILEWVSDLIGVEPQQLSASKDREGGRSPSRKLAA